MRSLTCGTRKLRPCLSHSRHRDRINLGIFRSVDRAGGCPGKVLDEGQVPSPWAIAPNHDLSSAVVLANVEPAAVCS